MSARRPYRKLGRQIERNTRSGLDKTAQSIPGVAQVRSEFVRGKQRAEESKQTNEEAERLKQEDLKNNPEKQLADQKQIFLDSIHGIVNSSTQPREQGLELAIAELEKSRKQFPDDLDIISQLNQYKSELFGIKGNRQISEFAKSFRTEADARRAKLSEILASQQGEQFGREQPQILEFLHARGYDTSPSVVGQSFAEVSRDLESERQRSLLNFDTDVFGQEQSLKANALSALSGGQQGALDIATQMDISGLERAYGRENLSRQLDFASQEGRRNRRNSLLNALLNLGGDAAVAAFGGVKPQKTPNPYAGSQRY